ncbi:hypothetical protein R3Q56_006703 [Pseudomonas aeruginosa]|nr:hypothetical protein [Pseudomonas aeruginosa]ELR2942332.1 hypothetical protein [Pseudomonas aeruginosa]
MAIICDFGTAPEQAKAGYKMVGTVTGTVEEILQQYADMDVRFVRGPAIHGKPGVWEFAAMHPARSMKVKHWSAYNEETSASATHEIEVHDQRGVNGQVYLTVGALEGALDEMLSVVAEVNTNPETGKESVPCIHVSFDSGAMAFSLFKIGDKILLRPENDVTLTRTDIANQTMYFVD